MQDDRIDKDASFAREPYIQSSMSTSSPSKSLSLVSFIWLTSSFLENRFVGSTPSCAGRGRSQRLFKSSNAFLAFTLYLHFLPRLRPRGLCSDLELLCILSRTTSCMLLLQRLCKRGRRVIQANSPDCFKNFNKVCVALSEDLQHDAVNMNLQIKVESRHIGSVRAKSV